MNPLGPSANCFMGVADHFDRTFIDQIMRAYRMSPMVGVIVDAKNETAKQFYERFEFDPLADPPLTLWIAISALTHFK